MPPSVDRVHDLSECLLKAAVERFPDSTPAELLSAVLTAAKALISVILKLQNDEHNRSEILRCVAKVEEEVWLSTPKEKLN